MSIPCVLKAIGSVCIYIMMVLYFGIGIYNAIITYRTCYMSNDDTPLKSKIPYYFTIPFFLNDFLFAILKMATRNFLKKEDELAQICK